MSNAPNGTASDSGFLSSFTFSNNLVEVGALTALVGSSVAESLVLGNRGAAGVAWAATSSFGTISVVKACFCGASSGWLRETLGIRTASSDSAVGLELEHNSNRAGKVRRNVGEPLAIFCHRKEEELGYIKGQKPRQTEVAWSDVYALDHSTSLMLRSVPNTGLGNPVQIFTYGNYTFLRNPHTRIQVPVIVLSAAKMIEVYVLWHRGASLLGLASAIPWFFFLIGAVVIETHEVLLSRTPAPEFGTLDIVAGQLPMVSHPGGHRKIILGVAENLRTYLLWRFFWAAGAVISTASMIVSYFIMSQQSRSTGFIWAGFQVLWLAGRIIVYHVADPFDPMALRMLVVRPWATLPADMKDRVMDLFFALAKYQSIIHPRGQLQYRHDVFATRELRLILDGVEPPNLYPLRRIHLPSFPVEIKTVFGDTSLSSAMWITGTHTTPMELYDSCIVVFAIPRSSTPVAVPAARVLSGASRLNFDAEMSMPVFVPKGVPNTGYGLTWWYWIPCPMGLWLQIQVPVDGKPLGTREAQVRTDDQVSALLAAGNLNIGFKNVADVKAIVELSRKARASFLELLS
ncbi:hypothetical protein B0H10DRAFT_487658 [Mycena sp. CBHHK59/15]|nr:hypothetical protein B0H10DRAFT_487658 [Mycena sp. CBHHK59/15]